MSANNCSTCNLRDQHQRLMSAVMTNDDPILMLHAIVSILLPGSASAADLCIISDDSFISDLSDCDTATAQGDSELLSID